MTWPTVSENASVQARYIELRANGQSHNMAEVLATRSFPGIAGTDAVFMQGRQYDGSQFEGLPPIVGEGYCKKAADAGVNTAGRYYCGSVARFPGDPRAWISGRSDVKRIVESEGWECRGAVKVEAPRYAEVPPPPEKYRVADDLVDRDTRAALLEDPSLEPFKAEVRDQIAQDRSGIHGQ